MMTVCCPTCREVFGLPRSVAGRPFTCPACHAVTAVPWPTEVHRPSPDLSTRFAVVLSCPRCSRVINAAPDRSDGWVGCPSCMLIFTADSPAPPPAVRQSADEPDGEAEGRPADANRDDADEVQKRRGVSRLASDGSRDVKLYGGVVAAAIVTFMFLMSIHHLRRADQRLQVAVLGGSGIGICFVAAALLFRLAGKRTWARSILYGLLSTTLTGCVSWSIWVAGEAVLVLILLAALVAAVLGAVATVVRTDRPSPTRMSEPALLILILLTLPFPPVFVVLTGLYLLGYIGGNTSPAPVGHCRICGRTAALVTHDICVRCAWHISYNNRVDPRS